MERLDNVNEPGQKGQEAAGRPWSAEALGTGLMALSGEWFVRKNCLAVAKGSFRDRVPSPGVSGLRGLTSGLKLQNRLFELRHGEGVVMCGGLIAVEINLSPETPLQVRLSRLFAFEAGLNFAQRLVRRVPMSGAGAWQSAVLSGSGRVIIGSAGMPVIFDVPAGENEIMDFAPEAVVAWQGESGPEFKLPRLTLGNFLLPSGVKDVRVLFSGGTRVWLDGGVWGKHPGGSGGTGAGRRSRQSGING